VGLDEELDFKEERVGAFAKLLFHWVSGVQP